MAARFITWILALLGILSSVNPSNAQLIKRLSGENIQPAFEGWEHNLDGSFNLVFGYLNRNYEEEPEIPIGPNNKIEPGGPDQGQPTYFYPRRQQFVFKVRVPPDWGEKRLVWTLTLHGRTDQANGWLNPEYELSGVVWSQNRGGTASDAATAEPNQPPSVKLDSPAQTTIVQGDPLNLTAFATDDGHPTPTPPRRRQETAAIARARASIRDTPQTQAIVRPPRLGLGITWIHYRGPGRVTFTPMSKLIDKNGQVSTSVTFAEPGTHVIRAYADDGVYTSPADITIIVKPRAQSWPQPHPQ